MGRQPRRSRWTIGGLMLLVAAVALPLGGFLHVVRRKEAEAAAASSRVLLLHALAASQTRCTLGRTVAEISRGRLDEALMRAKLAEEPSRVEPPDPRPGLAPRPPEPGTFRELGTWPESPGDRPFRPLRSGAKP